jgi:hypothetical protein
MVGHFCLIASQNHPQGQIHYIAVEVEMYTDLRQLDDIHSLFQVYVIYEKDSFFAVVNIMARLSHSHRKQQNSM